MNIFPSLIGQCYKTMIAIGGFTSCLLSLNAQEVYSERDGLVIIEAEDTTTSNLGFWNEDTEISGYTGDGYLEFTGNSPTNGPANSPISYKFVIDKSGLYYFNLHCAKVALTLNGEVRTDIANDAYIRVEGDYESGPNPGNSNGFDAPLDLLKSDTKFFGGNNNSFSWSFGNKLDPGGTSNKRVAVYNFKSGEEYTLIVSGRSQFFKIDRIVFRHESVDLSQAHDLNQPQSSRLPQLANAGPDRIIQISDTLISMDGSNSLHGEITSYKWTQTSGPTTVIFSDSNSVNPAVTNLQIGNYAFKLETTNLDGGVTDDSVQIHILPEGESFAAVESFSLMNIYTNEPIPKYDPIPNGAEININELDSNLYNIRINTIPNTNFGSVETVISSPISSENNATIYPWSALGKNPDGTLKGRPFIGGIHQITATPYGETGSGLTGTPLNLSFSFVDEPIITEPNQGKLLNISTRGRVGLNEEAMIAGFVIKGSTTKRVLIQALGQELSALNTDGVVLKNPQLTIVPSNTSNDVLTFITNNDWDEGNSTEISEAADLVGATPLTLGSGSAALVTLLQPGAYTVIVQDENNESSGIALVEVYDLD